MLFKPTNITHVSHATSHVRPMSQNPNIHSFFCWLAAWGSTFIGTPWQPNHFAVITLNQQLLIRLFSTFIYQLITLYSIKFDFF